MRPRFCQEAGEGATVQARKPRSWMLRVGGGPALTISIAPQKEDNVLVQWGNAKWGMQAVSGVAALIIFWPLLALPAYAAIKQKQLIDETLDFMDRYVGEAGGTQVAALPIAPMAASPAPKPQPVPQVEAHCPPVTDPSTRMPSSAIIVGQRHRPRVPSAGLPCVPAPSSATSAGPKWRRRTDIAMARKTRERSSTRKTVRLVLVLLVVGVGLTLLSWAVWRTWDWERLALNLGTELVGAALTYLLLARWVGEEEEEEDKPLLVEMSDDVKDVAVDAAGKVRKMIFGGAIRAIFPKKKPRS